MQSQISQASKRLAQSRLFSPARVRLSALRELWWYRNYWRLPDQRVAMRGVRNAELAGLAPIMLVLAFGVGLGLFTILPNTVGEQAIGMLRVAWPLWAVQVAPMASALAMAMLVAPSIALQLTEAEAAGQFIHGSQSSARERSVLAARMCVPLIMAYALVCLACSLLLIAFSIVFGLLSSVVMAIGDVRDMANLIFATVNPLMWLRSAASAWLLGLVCAVAAVVYAWPGTQVAKRALDAHRLGLRAMLVSSSTCVGAGVVSNWVVTMLWWG